jgi:putative colanic acid biosynthesis UDP-glucose lipid carrier transferase
MLKQKKSRMLLKNAGDILMVLISFLGAAFLARRHIGAGAAFIDFRGWEFLLLLFLCLAWNYGARAFELYDEFHNRSFRSEVTVLGENIILQAVLAAVVLFLAKSQVYSRYFLFAYYVLLLAYLLAWRAFLRLFLARRQKKGHSLCHILVIGSSPLALSFAETVEANRHMGYRLVGFVAAAPDPQMGDRYLGEIGRLDGLLATDRIDEVIFASSRANSDELGRVIAICGRHPVHVRIIPLYSRYLGARFRISRFGSFPLFSIRAVPLEQAHLRLLKRAFDLLVALLAFLLIFSWLWPLLALLIKATSPGPVFFKQERWGEKNKRFLCYKFRSMVQGSRDVDENGHYQQARRDDPRVTRLGSFLRRSNLDELPQFINILRGDMSLIGPRPHPTPMNLEATETIHNYQWRHLVKPGISGWAQVNGFRGETSDPEMLCRRVQADIWYIENWSFALDLKILWLSLRAMCIYDPNAY